MRLGLQVPRFNWATGQIGPTLAAVGRAADEAGFSSLWTMDHFFQIRSIGSVDEPMLEAYTTLGYLAAHTQRIRLGTLVTGAMYRHPGALVKQVTTLDVLSGGRAWLGIGAGWYEREARGLGLPFPRVKERFELLEETLKIALHMWQGSMQPMYGKHYSLAEPLSSPPPVSQPHPPILIGGGGERKTLRLVARYADACNLFARYGAGELQWKLEVLQQHCESEHRDFASIDRSVLTNWNTSRHSAQQIVDQIGEYQRLGFTTVIAALTGVEKLQPIEVMARDVIPHLA
jgi:F420-dependent oxidoreductase-like protein